MVSSPRTQLQIVQQEEGSVDVSGITLKPTMFQKVSMMEEVMPSRKTRICVERGVGSPQRTWGLETCASSTRQRVGRAS